MPVPCDDDQPRHVVRSGVKLDDQGVLAGSKILPLHRLPDQAARRLPPAGRLSAQGVDVPEIAKVAFTSEDRVRNADGFDSLYPRYKAGYPLKFTLGQRREINKIAKSKPAEHDPPFSAWSLSKLAEFLVAEVPYL